MADILKPLTTIGEQFASKVGKNVANAAKNTFKKAAGGSARDFQLAYKAFGANGNKTVQNELRPLLKQAFTENPEASIDEIVNIVKANPKYIAPPTASPVAKLKGFNSELRGPGRIDDAAYERWLREEAQYAGSNTEAAAKERVIAEKARANADQIDNETINDFTYSAAEEQDRLINHQVQQNAQAAALDQEEILNGSASATSPGQSPTLRANQPTNTLVAGQSVPGVVKQNERMAYESEMQATEAALEAQGKMTEREIAKDQAKRIEQETKRRSEMKKRASVNEFNYDNAENRKYFEDNNSTPWSSTAKAALGTAVGGAALMAALSSSRGQQNNAQLYGQQPLY